MFFIDFGRCSRSDYLGSALPPVPISAPLPYCPPSPTNPFHPHVFPRAGRRLLVAIHCYATTELLILMGGFNCGYEEWAEDKM